MRVATQGLRKNTDMKRCEMLKGNNESKMRTQKDWEPAYSKDQEGSNTFPPE